jgi:hypothetical protein
MVLLWIFHYPRDFPPASACGEKSGGKLWPLGEAFEKGKARRSPGRSRGRNAGGLDPSPCDMWKSLGKPPVKCGKT